MRLLTGRRIHTRQLLPWLLLLVAVLYFVWANDFEDDRQGSWALWEDAFLGVLLLAGAYKLSKQRH